MRTLTATTQAIITPASAIQLLKDGNQRFVMNLKFNRNLLEQVNETKDGQYPFAAILSCMDSRTSAELIFDQGLGDIFSIRIAGNVLNEDILGSMEYACKVVGSKLIVVLGHTKCGAIKGACAGVKLDNLTGLLDKVKPAIAEADTLLPNADKSTTQFVETVAEQNVLNTVKQILEQSPILNELYQTNKIGIVSAMYNVESGEVTFLQEQVASL